jgi:8-oxo-dGTP pyrophosphatase MutT (NUDIX family)
MTLLKIINPENASEAEIAKFRTRESARAIVFDKDGNVGILHVSKQNYHKLPGGGIEAGEDIYTALKRECQEELGCDVEVGAEVGQIIEYRKIFQLKQTSFIYSARLVGEKGQPSFTSDEIADGFQIQWLPLEEAIRLLASDQPLNDEGRLYIVPRDRILLAAAKEMKKGGE